MNSNAIARFVDQTLAEAQSDKDKNFYTNRCDGLDRQISDPRPVFTHGGSGWPLVSGAKGSISSPTI